MKAYSFPLARNSNEKVLKFWRQSQKLFIRVFFVNAQQITRFFIQIIQNNTQRDNNLNYSPSRKHDRNKKFFIYNSFEFENNFFIEVLDENFLYVIKMQLNCCVEGKSSDCGNFSSWQW
jgi:hypothetical protein